MIPSKQEFYDALVARHGADNQKKLDDATVAICGLGGLGSNIAICLARAGVGRLILIDFDQVDVTNLHRQQYKINQVGMNKTDALAENLREINPYILIETHQVMITEDNALELTKDADIVCEAFDKAESKAMLVNTILEKAPDRYILSSSGMAGFSDANLITTKRISEKFYLSGDSVSDVNDGIGLISSRVMVCAGHEAHKVLQIIISS
ncbi:MAG: thiamine biosynthesis protein ThiF [Pseudobutyrivibrio sp.]|nr:thiamine biosynthesis protein ThiF [Pseudobutyrivibrio sp.]